MLADQMYYEWLHGIPDQMDNKTFDRLKARKLEEIAVKTSLTITEVKNIFK